MKLFFKVFLFCALSIFVARFTHRQTKGFRLSKIQENTAPSSLPPLLHTEEEKEEARTLLQGKFTYLGRGLQSFCFLSEEGNTVLKLFNNRYQRKIFWLRLLPFTEKEVSYLESKLCKTFESYVLAYKELKKETGLLYLQIHPSEIEVSVTILDPLHIEHTVSLKETAFLLQKKAEPFYVCLERLIYEGKEKEAQEALISLIDFLRARCEKGIGDNDPLIRTNFGFVGTALIEFDVGPFSKDPMIAKPEVYQKEILRITTSLKEWLEVRDPRLAAFLIKLLNS